MYNVSSRERAVRRVLSNNGFVLKKTPARSEWAKVHGIGYMIVEAYRSISVSGTYPLEYSDTLEDVENFAKSLALA